MIRLDAWAPPQSRRRPLSLSLHALDLALFTKVARSSSPVLDATLPRLSHAANHSRLWAGLAVLLALLGRRRDRRAALRGMLAVGLTSAVTNGPLKMVTRRKRPPIALVPLARQVRRKPITSSFPSGHSASAAAFATAVALERPALAIPVGAVAAAVGVSRVYNGAHYPSDVVVGAAIGAAVAVATTRVWPVKDDDDPARARSVLVPTTAAPSPDGAGLSVTVNPSSGHALQQDHAAALREALPQAEVIELARPDDLEPALRAAAASARVLGVAGGDGSVNLAAQVAREAGKPLFVVPGGTLNHLARDLGIESVDDAVDALRNGQTAAIDVGLIDDHVFLNTASFGGYVDLVDARERMEDAVGKWPAMLAALVKVLARGRPVEVEIDGEATRLWMIFIGNCRYRPSGFAPSWRERLDDNELDIRIVHADRPLARLRLILAILSGTLGHSRVYESRTAREIKVRSLAGPLRLARDGETFDGSAEFTVSKIPVGLTVFAPCAS